MKTLVSTLVLSLSMAGMSYAQTIIYSQDFENNNGNIPAGISIDDSDNCSVVLSNSVYDFWNLIDGNTAGDTGIYVSSSFITANCAANDWLRFDTAIVLPTTGNIYLKYGYLTTAATNLDIYVSTLGSSQANFLADTPARTYSNQNQANYGLDSINLNAYKGRTIFIAFNNVTLTTSGHGIYLDDVQLIHHTIVGVNKTESSSFQCYPNPANTQLTVKLSSANEAVLRVYNALGQEVHQAMVQNGQLDMNTAQFVSGMYTISIQTGAQLQTERVLIQH